MVTIGSLTSVAVTCAGISLSMTDHRRDDPKQSDVDLVAVERLDDSGAVSELAAVGRRVNLRKVSFLFRHDPPQVWEDWSASHRQLDGPVAPRPGNGKSSLTVTVAVALCPESSLKAPGSRPALALPLVMGVRQCHWYRDGLAGSCRRGGRAVERVIAEFETACTADRTQSCGHPRGRRYRFAPAADSQVTPRTSTALRASAVSSAVRRSVGRRGGAGVRPRVPSRRHGT